MFEQTPRICFGVLGIFFGTLEIFQRRSEQQAGGSSPATDNKFEQTTRILGFFGPLGFFKGNESNKWHEAGLPDNVSEQTPRICGILGFFGTLGIFQRQSEQHTGRSLSAKQRV